jgi:hypothetical protein
MALRYSCKNVAVAQAGKAFTHSLGDTPDEWAFNHRGVPPAAASRACTLYLAAVGSTTITLASASGATTADVFAVRNHSIIR